MTRNSNSAYLNIWLPSINPRSFDVIQQWRMLKFFTADTCQKKKKKTRLITLRHY